MINAQTSSQQPQVKWLAFFVVQADDKAEPRGLRLPEYYECEKEAIDAAELAMLQHPGAISCGSRRLLLN